MADLNLSFLNESKNTDLIRWSDNGNSFIVLDEDEFAKILILELFKHNNYASFVRRPAKFFNQVAGYKTFQLG
ncbi:Heat shock factor protein [Aspergillus fumigatus Z5]|nr:Heat shock factor protein [Aspergillus fumigatus Z5]